jgi:hypothetical protein
METTTQRYVNPDPSFIANPDGTLSFHWYKPGTAERAVEVILDPWAALNFLRGFASNMSHALDDALDHATVGPCETCKGFRLIEVEHPSGRGTHRVHCPECRPRVIAARERYAASVPKMVDTNEALT